MRFDNLATGSLMKRKEATRIFVPKNHHRDQSTYKVYEDETQTNGKVHSRFNLDLLRFPALGDDFNFRGWQATCQFLHQLAHSIIPEEETRRKTVEANLTEDIFNVHFPSHFVFCSILFGFSSRLIRFNDATFFSSL